MLKRFTPRHFPFRRGEPVYCTVRFPPLLQRFTITRSLTFYLDEANQFTVRYGFPLYFNGSQSHDPDELDDGTLHWYWYCRRKGEVFEDNFFRISPTNRTAGCFRTGILLLLLFYCYHYLCVIFEVLRKFCTYFYCTQGKMALFLKLMK